MGASIEHFMVYIVSIVWYNDNMNPKTLEYAGTACLENGEEIELPYDRYEVEDLQPAEPDVGIMQSYCLINVPGEDSPVCITGDCYDAFAQDMRDNERENER